MTPWIVLKFGGTSVSTVDRWRTIAAEARARHETGLRPLIVCSAMSGVSNRLEALARDPRDHDATLAWIRERHDALATAMGLDLDAILGEELDRLGRVALGAALIGEAGPKVHARLMAAGELLSTRLGAAFLNQQGLPTAWFDARDGLVASDPASAPESRRILSANVDFERDEALGARLAAVPEPVVLTQGFIARDRDGATVLLGRGGSDTSASTFAAKLGATVCEIWTDVPGMYTANPRQVRSARLLRHLDYDEAMEIASMGAKVLHPRCLPPVRAHGIPLDIRSTEQPDAEGTRVSGGAPSAAGIVKSVSSRSGLTLVVMETPAMWQQVGFLADVFGVFKRHGVSVDLVSTSESNVTVSLDPSANTLPPAMLQALIADLAPWCEARAVGPTAAVSLVGRGIRGLLHRLGPALEAFEDQRVHLVSQAASDLNLTFVVDDDQAERLVRALHALLFPEGPLDPVFGPPMNAPTAAPAREPWWRRRREALLALPTPTYVYDADTIDARADDVLGLGADRVLYAVKANPNAEVLRRVGARGLGFECVSPGELRHVMDAVPGVDPRKILYTPNFAPRDDYRAGVAAGVWVTLDNLHPLEAWGEDFRGRDVFVRVDPGQGRGHHRHVHTAGMASKFGVHPGELPRLRELANRHGVRVVGLHAHAGSGIRDAGNWSENAIFLAQVAADHFPDVQILDLGGGLGVVERPGQSPLDLGALAASIATFRQANPQFQLWLEPGRWLVAEAGVLLARVTQRKQKGDVHWVGVDTGMNSLIRPALYGAWHEIVNLTRLDAPMAETAHVVGPICESGDVLGHDRRLPTTVEGDVLLIGTAGAYGRSMSSRYNLREPAAETLLGPLTPA